MCCKILLSLLAVVLPPLAVLFETGCDCNLLINFLLTLLGVVPGIIHAWYVIWCRDPVQHTHTTVYIQGNQQPEAPPAYH